MRQNVAFSPASPVRVALLGIGLLGSLALSGVQAQTVPQYATPSAGTGANSFPLNTTASNRVQLQYQAGEFGVPFPGRITHVYLHRANTTTTPSTFTNLTISMAQTPTWPTATAAWYAPVTQVYTAPSTIIPPGNINDWFAIQLPTPFLYDPSEHLIVNISQSAYTTGITLRNTTGSAPTPRRLWGGVAAAAPTGSDGTLYHFGFDMTPASGLYANFEADVTIGAAPLRVQFTDKTFSSDPGGVTSWAWDLNGDTRIDSTIQNPIWTYPTQGRTVSYDVTLTATDAAHPRSVMTKRNFITVDPPPTADFSANPTSGSVLPGGPPLIVRYTDLSIGATAWAWDLNGNTQVDSTVQNPVYPYITGGFYSVTLSVTGVGGNDRITKNNFIYVSDVMTAVVPAGTATTPGNSSTAYPWNTSYAAGHRIQYCYDTSNFVGITGPILIRQLRWRSYGVLNASWTGASYANVVIDLSSAAFDQASLTTTFATNHGPDRANVFTGNVTVDPCAANTVPGVWYVTVRFQNPFLYDPTRGDDLLIDITLPGARLGGTSYSMDCQTTGSLTSRMYSLSNATSPTGTFQANVGPVLEVGYMPAAGLHPNFDADVTIGAAPLRVQFSDTSYTSDPGGVTSWAWDLTGDTRIDATLQNPIWTYPTQGRTVSYDVSLSVTDATNPPATALKRGFITVDPPPVADFDATPRGGAVRPGGPPLMVQFTDLSIGATAWAWDLTGDTRVDSTVQNPLFPYTAGGNFSVTLSVTGVGGNDRITKTNFISITDTPLITTLFAGGNGGSSGWVNLFDINVKAPGGIWITALDVNCSTYNVPVTLDVYVTPNTYVGKELNPALWTQVSTGSGMTAPAANQPTPVDVGDFHLAPGRHGIAILYTGSGMSYTDGTGANQNYANNDLDLFTGASVAGFFSGSLFTPRVWNGTIYYITRGWPKYGLFGEGCRGSNGVPALAPAMGSIPRIGTTFTLNLSSMPTAGGSALVLIGLSKSRFAGLVPLPFDLGFLGARGCALLTDILASLGVANVGGQGSLNLPIPNDPALVGGYLVNQALVLDPAANTLGLTVTGGGEMHIGN